MLLARHGLILILFYFICLTQNFAGPAGSHPFKVMQPDGSVITLRGFGDEFLNYKQTVDGYTVLKEEAGYYVYAMKDNSHNLIPSGIKVSNMSQRTSGELSFLEDIEKNLLYSDEVLEAAKAIRVQINELRSKKSEENRLAKKSNDAVHWNVCVLLIEYPDLPHTLSIQQIEDLFNQDGFDGGYESPGSFNDYYSEISYGKFSITADIHGWYMAPNQYEYYANYQNAFWERSQQLTVSALDQADAAGVDFTKYDNDGDNIVEQVIVIHSGLGAAQYSETEYVWPHQNGIWSSYSRTLDGMYIDSYTMQEELHHNTWTDDTPRQAGIGMYAHEFGHALGLPDLYPYSSDNDNATVGEWCNMASGAWVNYGKTPTHLCSWCKDDLGWISPQVIESNGTIDFNSIEFDETGYKRFNVHSDNSEYFLVGNRHREGFDSHLPGEGLLILHIDTDRNHRSSVPRRVDVEEADGKDELKNGSDRGDDGDIFPGSKNNRNFDAFSNPNSNSHSDQFSIVSISNISDAGAVMTADVNVEGMAIIGSDVKSGHAPLTVNFNDVSITSTPFTTWNWDFTNDGAFDANEQNPAHTYDNAGNYSVSFAVSNDNYNQTITMEDYVKVFNGFSALSFEQEEAFALVGAADNINLTSLFSIEAWINPKGWGPDGTYGLGTIFEKSYITIALQKTGTAAYNGHSITLSIKDANRVFSYYGTPENSINLNEWQHIAVTVDAAADEVKMYVNGIGQQLSISGSIGGSVRDNASKGLYIGNTSTKNKPFDGTIDELRIWNVVRTGDEIANSMNKYVLETSSSLVGYWKMEEGNGEIIVDGSPSANNGSTSSLWEQGITLDPVSGLEELNMLPTQFSLSQNYPNPFNPATKIKFSLPKEADATLSVFNILGQEITKLVDEKLPAGYHEFDFNASSLSSGVYFYRLQVIENNGSTFVQTNKMMLIK